MSSVSSGLSVEVRRTIIDRSMVFCSWMTMSENCTQLQNYQRKMAQKMQREEDLRTGLRLYKSVKWFFLLAMISLQFKDPFDLWKLQGWEIWGGIGEVRVGIGIKTREQRGCHCQLQCCLLLFQTQPGWILLCSLISHYASHVCSLILNTHMNIPPQIQAGLSALEDALKSGYEDFKVTTSSFAGLLHETQ